MWYTILCIIPLLLISITMLGRANDLGTRPGKIWHIRRVGLILAGVMPWGMCFTIIRTDAIGVSFYDFLFWWGAAIVFMTSPFLPPWWKWMLLTGEDVVGDDEDRRGLPKE